MVKIYTLGDFDIMVNDVSILESLGNQPKLMRLFKYFLTFQGKKLLPERIIEDLWEDEDFKDPLVVLRTQISRVRKMIDLEKYNMESFFEINFTNGYYFFKMDDNCTIDFIQIEEYMKESSSLKNQEETMEVFKKGIKLYKGEYLAELGNESWLMPSRTRIDRIYTKSLVQYLRLLKEKAMYNNIVVTCEEAIVYKPYEEIIHIYLMED